MLKLVYDLKAGFEDCYLTIKDEEWDLTTIADGILMTEKDFYDAYINNLTGLLTYLNNTWELSKLCEESSLRISKLFFSHMLKPGRQLITIWEPSNWRLVLDTTRSGYYYNNAMSASDVCNLLKLTRQQLHYYVKTRALRKEYNPENSKQFRYNRTDVYVLQKKLEKKYDRYK